MQLDRDRSGSANKKILCHFGITFGESPGSFLRLHPDFRDAAAGNGHPATASLHGLKPDTVEELLPSLYRRQPKYPAAATL